jgi:tetratricopeptide (TPR) repeat protein
MGPRKKKRRSLPPSFLKRVRRVSKKQFEQMMKSSKALPKPIKIGGTLMPGFTVMAIDPASGQNFLLIGVLVGTLAAAGVLVFVVLRRMKQKEKKRAERKGMKKAQVDGVEDAFNEGKELGFEDGLNQGIDEGKELGFQEAEEEYLRREEERKEKGLKDDIDYDRELEDLDKFTEELGDEGDRPIIQNINKYVTGYKFLKPIDVNVLSITKRFDEYEVSMELPQEQKGASKISEFVHFEDDTRAEIRDEYLNTAQFNNTMVGIPGGGGMASMSLDKLTNLGRELNQNYMPETIQKHLKDVDDPVIVESNDGEILWETIHDGEDFMCLKVPVGRVLKTKEEARVNEFERGERFNFLLVANPTSDLESTEKEVNYIESILKDRVNITKIVKDEATREKLLEVFGSGNFDVIHYAGHADSESEGEASLIAADGKLFSSEIKEKLNGRPYVYLNACGSGREEMHESKDQEAQQDTEGLASAFILGGSIGFMGAFWPIPDKSAAEFCVNFYDGLIENKQVGEAARLARQELKKMFPNDITWAAFLQYGDPVQKLREKKDDEEEEEGEEGEEEEKEEEEEQLSDEEKKKLYEAWIIGGRKHMDEKKWEEAITAFDTAIGYDPDRYNAWHLTGNCLRELRRYNEAMEIYDKAIEREDEAGEIWYDKAMLLGAMGRFEDALKSKEIGEKLDAGKEKELLKQASKVMSQGGYKEAITMYEKVVKTMPEYPVAWYLMGVAQHELGDDDSALKNFDKSIKVSKRFAKSYFKKGDILYDRGDKEGALEQLNTGLRMNPINEEALSMRAKIMTDMERFDDALQDYDILLRIDKSNAIALEQKARILNKFDKPKKELAAWEGVLNLNPNNTSAQIGMALVLKRLGEEDKAKEELTKALEMEITNEEDIFILGREIGDLEGHEQEKLKIYDEIIKRKPKSSIAWYNRGRALEILGETDDALESYRRTVKFKPSHKDAWLRRSMIAQVKADEEELLECLNKLLKFDSNDVESLMRKAPIVEKGDDKKAAFKIFEKLTQLMPDELDNWEKAYALAKGVGFKKKSKVLLFTLVELSPSNVDYRRDELVYLHQDKEYEKFLSRVDPVIEARPDDTQLIKWKAEILLSSGRDDEALEALNAFIAAEQGRAPEPVPIPEEEPVEDEEELEEVSAVAPQLAPESEVEDKEDIYEDQEEPVEEEPEEEEPVEEEEEEVPEEPEEPEEEPPQEPEEPEEPPEPEEEPEVPPELEESEEEEEEEATDGVFDDLEDTEFEGEEDEEEEIPLPPPEHDDEPEEEEEEPEEEESPLKKVMMEEDEVEEPEEDESEEESPLQKVMREEEDEEEEEEPPPPPPPEEEEPEEEQEEEDEEPPEKPEVSWEEEDDDDLELEAEEEDEEIEIEDAEVYEPEVVDQEVSDDTSDREDEGPHDAEVVEEEDEEEKDEGEQTDSGLDPWVIEED